MFSEYSKTFVDSSHDWSHGCSRQMYKKFYNGQSVLAYFQK
jgi:hypothetical protein